MTLSEIKTAETTMNGEEEDFYTEEGRSPQ